MSVPALPPGGPDRTGRRIRTLIGGALVLGIVLWGAALLAATLSTSRTRTVTTTVTAPTNTAAGASWATLYARTAPGTVDISVETTQTVMTPFGAQQEKTSGTGSGFVLDARGDIVTAGHVVDGASAITVTFENGLSRAAKLVGLNDQSDVALIRVEPAGLHLHPLALGSSRSLVVGDPLAAIGDPFGFTFSLSTGVVSGLDRTIQAPDGHEITGAIQTDAAMNPGNSGGPLLDTDGRVVGIADQIATGTNEFGRSDSDTNTGIGFAIPIDLIRADLPALERGAR